MRVAKSAMSAALALALAGCDYVASKHPVGETPLALEESEWEGAWLEGDSPVTVRVVDAKQGLLQAAWVEERDGEFVMDSVDVFLRRFEDWTFASFAGVDQDEPNLLWGRLGRDDRNGLFLWWPRPEAFKRLVEEGRLPGTIDGDDVLLERLEAEHLAIIASEEQGVLFEWDEPMTFYRPRG
jgi:hypothetical protein